MKISSSTRNILILCIAFFQTVRSQSLNNLEMKNLEMRYENALRSNTSMDFSTATRFMSVYSPNTISDWTSPASTISINGIPFNAFPLNFDALDILPIDLLQSDSIEITNHPSLQDEASAGKINFVTKPIDNSFRLRGFLGSETGDPLIYTFTRTSGTENKNKIAPSGAISYSNNKLPLAYRITAGYFGFYSTGSVNDETMNNLNPYFYLKQNKQILGSAELKYNLGDNKKVSLYSSIITYYGWDVPPFLTTFTHFETYLHTIRLNAENILDGFSFSLINDGSITKITQTTEFLPTKFGLSNISLLLKWNKNFSKQYRIEINSNITNLGGNDLSSGIDSSQRFFNSSISKWNYGIGINNYYDFTNTLTGNINFRYERNFDNNSLDGEVKLTNNFSSGLETGINISSVVYAPNLSDLYGNFTYDIAGSQQFGIRGNENLKPERINHFGLEINKTFEKDNVSFSGNIFYETINDPIKQKTLFSERFSSFADIIRNAIYINGINEHVFAGDFSLDYTPTDFFKLLSNYTYMDNSEIQFVPKNKLYMRATFIFPFKGEVSLEFQYKGRSFFDEYQVSKDNDNYWHTGFDGLVPETNIFGITFQQKLINFYFMKEILFDISISNIFDKSNKYLPIGNNLDRAFIFSIYSVI
jgi:hypothetical protein